MNRIAEFFWHVANDRENKKAFNAEFAPYFVEKFGQSLTGEEKLLLSTGDSNKISEYLTQLTGGTAWKAENTFNFITEPEPSTPREEEVVEAAPTDTSHPS